MALVRVSSSCCGRLFRRRRLTAGERIIAAMVWGWLALYITDLAPCTSSTPWKGPVPHRQAACGFRTVLRGVVTVFLTVVFALWVAGARRGVLMRLHTLDANLRIVGVPPRQAVADGGAILASLAMVGIDMTALSVFTGARCRLRLSGPAEIASNYVPVHHPARPLGSAWQHRSGRRRRRRG